MRYRGALEAYAHKRFFAADGQVDDWFQGFVEGPILRRGLIVQARPMEGRQFRSYLLSAWHTHILEVHRRDMAGKRQPAGGLVPLPESPDVDIGALPPPAPERFDVAWARGVLDQAARLMRERCEVEARKELWGVFEERVYRPILEGGAPLPYERLIERFGIDSPTQARNLLVTGKRLFARCLREVVGQYACGEAAVEAELRELQAILAQTAA